MARNNKIIYTNLIDEKFSCGLYNNNEDDDICSNAKNISNKKDILKAIVKNELTFNQQIIFILYYNHNLTMTQISKRIGRNKSSVSRALKRCRDKIENFMKYNSNFRNESIDNESIDYDIN